MDFEFKNVLVTGAAGFIGFYLCRRLLNDGARVTGVDNFSPYYDVRLKEARLDNIRSDKNFTFVKMDLADHRRLNALFNKNHFDVVVNLAAQAGVRYSLQNPHAYVESNLVGFVNILECCRHHGVKHLVFASSSSVYGANTNMPFSVHHNVDHPVSLYAATKKANELMAHTYSHLYRLALHRSAIFYRLWPLGASGHGVVSVYQAILNSQPIQVFNHGKMRRDFTYIDDIIEGVVRVMSRLPEPNPEWRGDHPDPGTSYAPYKIYNIGNNNPVELLEFIEVIENALGHKAKKEFADLQPGDVVATYADVDDLMKDVGFRPQTPIETGIQRFIAWYKDYYKIK